MNTLPDHCPTCGAVLAGGLCRRCLLRAGLGTMPTSTSGHWMPPTPEELEAQLTKYRVMELLGHGGMGAVYKGWQISLERDVAIKVLSPAIMEEDFTARFRQEARTMARLSHPAIVSVYDFDETADGLCYIVMEFIEGTDVQQMIASNGKLPPDRALAIAMHVCDALSYAHEHGIIHRDIKPANVMVDTQGRVKVADFGLAKVTKVGAALLTGTNVTMGTPGYIAPEILTAGRNVDARADVYAMGVMLYVMLAGKVPHGRFEAASERVPGLDPRFDHIVNRAMQDEREARYASAAELRADLTTILTVPMGQANSQFANAVGSKHLETSFRESTLATSGALSLGTRPSSGRSRIKARVALIGLAAAVCAIGWFAWIPWSHIGAAARHPESARPGLALLASTDQPFVNSLGMKFVPVPITGGRTNGQRVLFSVWDTRVQDYEVFVKETGLEWPNPDFPQGPAHPAVMMSWEDAQLFCKWLTRREQAAGRLPPEWRYRLPSDHEWSCAVGLGAKEDPAKCPAEKNKMIPETYPWGAEWPPPAGAGNYAGEEVQPAFALGKFKDLRGVLIGYRDDFVNTAPVGSFAANRFGLFDMGGNVWQLCEDWYDRDQKEHVLRGASWNNFDSGRMLSSGRIHGAATRSHNDGLRCVLAPVSTPGTAASALAIPSATSAPAKPSTFSR